MRTRYKRVKKKFSRYHVIKEAILSPDEPIIIDKTQRPRELFTLPRATVVVAMSNTKSSPGAAGAARLIGFVPRSGCKIKRKKSIISFILGHKLIHILIL